MASSETLWSLATFAQGGQAVAALEVNGVAYRLAPSLARVGLAGQDSVAGLFGDWARALAALNAAAAQVQASDQITPSQRLAPLLYPGKILCAGANYFDHLAEMGMPGAKKEDQRLFFFMKPPRNAVVGEGDTVHMPINTQAFDWEVELALVIGKTARNVSVEQALSHVAAYTVAIDFSARDHNRAPETFYQLDWVAGKGHDGWWLLGIPCVLVLRGPDRRQRIGDGTLQDGYVPERKVRATGALSRSGAGEGQETGQGARGLCKGCVRAV